MYLKQLINISLITFLTTALIACSSDDDDDLPDNSISENPNQTSMPADEVTPGENISGAPAGVNGSWFLSCRMEDSIYQTVELNIQDDVIETITTDFSDNSCTTAEQFSPQTITSSIVYTGITETALGPASNIDLTVENVVIADLEQSGVELDGVGVMFLDILLVMNDSLFLGERVEDETLDPDVVGPRPLQLNQTDEFIRVP